MEEYRVRIATVDDLPSILEVEHASFAHPWTEEAFYNEIVSNQFASYLLIERDGELAGYCGVWVIIDEAHITNIAILPSFRGKKLGEALMREAMVHARKHGADRMSLEVRVSNAIAQNLYSKLGFEHGGIRKNYYSDNGEDALVMWVML
ncbi:ribosomal-protein-alanine acetyltransferase [Fictibacillus macauensis ZFHKF-1]|uniref:[Ribosomal protein bS18]-alanine N-acetyltransferase n=1 Tax=Fictibacillus macauensis ZFHKF-1 TaxID=1196324 RepID=I8UBT0_9BACL|nr:ribosomal protein S18-alanine N-acetyltransferase [Fictibacillus macauensis]EIT84400.1 ribosomal-protein-alanine acetyltransferase [Fictibacillus macauensis ZFHKF-1]